ncbi:MAG: lasso RiPP family leader peptide-containing protein [Richelia sp. RM2_1_2]|nr:lasso RiPP family leader peptide-containing protein [Richelia sp. RM1_1_1]NJO59171.1 lasso RiPP family leader peptide-containing protein [Richelia sp. RM2_1_2]
MAEEIQDNKENQPENVDNRLPYEKPKLRKHGKVNDTTLGSPIPGIRADSRFGAIRDRS